MSHAITVPDALIDRTAGALAAAGLALATVPTSPGQTPRHVVSHRRARVDPDRPTLTEREVQVLRGMAEGKTKERIGAELHLSGLTVKSHCTRLYRKLGAHNAPHAVHIGWQLGLLGGAE